MTSQKHKPKIYSTGDPGLDLVAAVYRQALADAKRGDGMAIRWLQVVAPDVAEAFAVTTTTNRTGKPPLNENGCA